MCKASLERYRCAETGKTVDLPFASTASPYRIMGCSPHEKRYPKCSTCDLVHCYEKILPNQPKGQGGPLRCVFTTRKGVRTGGDDG